MKKKSNPIISRAERARHRLKTRLRGMRVKFSLERQG